MKNSPENRRGNSQGNKLRVSRAATKQPQIRQWRASLIRKHGQMLGYVEARDRAAAEFTAVREFNLSDEQRKRLVVQERL